MMAKLKTMMACTENGKIDMAWVESDLFGPSTIKQILKGNHVKRAEAAHLVTLQPLLTLYQEAFLSREGQSKKGLLQLAQQLEEACSSGGKEEVVEALK